MKMWQGFIVSSSDPQGYKNSIKVIDEKENLKHNSHVLFKKTISYWVVLPLDALMS